MTRRLTLALSACVLALAALASIAACGDDDAGSTNGGPATGTAQTSPSAASATVPASSAPANTSEPVLAAPASQYAILLTDVGTSAFITNIPATVELDAASYGATELFASAAEGEAQMKAWGYQGGYETAMWPEGREAAMLNGAFIINMEVHLFASIEGANSFYDYWLSKIQSAGVGQPTAAAIVGNESKAFKAVSGTIRNSKIAQAYHQIVFRRGSLVVVLQTIGAEPFMKVDTVVSLAGLVDRKALGELPAVIPTPTSNFTPASQRSPSPAATARP